MFTNWIWMYSLIWSYIHNTAALHLAMILQSFDDMLAIAANENNFIKGNVVANTWWPLCKRMTDHSHNIPDNVQTKQHKKMNKQLYLINWTFLSTLEAAMSYVGYSRGIPYYNCYVYFTSHNSYSFWCCLFVCMTDIYCWIHVFRLF